jgi:hypothetical protein
MVDLQYITITVQFDREPDYGRSLEWIAPPIDEQFAKAWRLPKDIHEPSARTPSDDRGLATHTHTLYGMNWETGNQSPIVYVSLQLTAPAPPKRQRRARPEPPIGPRP